MNLDIIPSCICCKKDNQINSNTGNWKIDYEFNSDNMSLKEFITKSSQRQMILIQSFYRRYEYKNKFRGILQKRIQVFDSSIIRFGKFITDDELNQRIAHIKRFEKEKGLEAFKLLENERRRFCLFFVKSAFCFNDNTIYKGSWNYFGKKNGYGIFIQTNGSMYEGIWEDDKMCGRGRYIDIKGNYYEGNWYNGNAHGKGTLNLTDGSTYEGEWKDDVQNGYGREVFADGSQFEGYYLNGNKEGEGKFTWTDNSIYEGSFSNSAINGNGTFKWSDGRKYTGQWLNNKIHGKGVFEWPNNKKYEGEYNQYKKEGKGTYYWTKNTFYTGNWLNNIQHGEGEFHHNGIVTKGIFRFGKFVQNNQSKTDYKQVTFNPEEVMYESTNNKNIDNKNMIPNIKESFRLKN